MPERSPSASSSARPSASAGVLDGVVGPGLQVAVDVDDEVEAAVTREQVEHVVEEPDAGPALAGTGPVEPELEVDPGLGRRAVDVSAAGHGRPFSRTSMDAACRSNPSARASAASGRCQGARGAADADLAHAAAEVTDVEAGGEACGPARRQRVVGAGDVVAEGGGTRRADEEAAGGAHLRGQRLRRGALQLQVLGRERLGEGERRRRVRHADERERGAAVAGVRQPGADVVEERVVLADGDRERPLAVLGLGEQVDRDERRVGSLGGDHEHVARTGEAVDADEPRDESLGLLDPRVPRARR